MAFRRVRNPVFLALAACAGLVFAAVAAVATAQPSAAPTAPITVRTPPPPTAYSFIFDGLITDHVALGAYRGKVVLVVNTASRCGFKAQLGDLQALYTEFAPAGLMVVGVPSGDFAGQELDTAKEIADFCQLNYGVTFPMAAKSHVKGAEAHPFYRWAQLALGDSAVPQWNFHKILIGRDGRAIAAYGTRVSPVSPEFKAAIQAALRAPA